jgi:predicted ester cyclase
VLEGDSGVAAEVVWRGVNDGALHTPMGDLPPTGRTIEIPFSLWFSIEAGLIKTAHVYMDAMSFAAQLGLIPGPQG